MKVLAAFLKKEQDEKTDEVSALKKILKRKMYYATL